MTIIIRVYSSPSSITYAINKINATPPQDPAIKILQNQVKDLQTNMTNAQTQIQQLTQQINIMNNTQKQMLVNITNLWNAFDKLNASLTDLTDIVNNINTSQNYSKNITWIEQNITHIKQDISKLFSNDTSNYYSLLTDLQITNRWLMNLSDQFYLLANDTSKIYNDTALKNQIAQLQKENAQLRANIDTLNKTKNEKTIEKRADNTVSYGAIALGIVALIVGIIAIMTRMPKTPTKDDSDEASRSKDYEEVEEKPKEIPKAKAKKSKDDDDEDLDDVMKKLEK
jgi:prefoldin subunit 5